MAKEPETQFTMPEGKAGEEIRRLLEQSGALPMDKGHAKKVKGKPQFVFTQEGEPRTVGGFARVSNGFQDRNGVVVRKLSDDASLVRVNDLELVVHEPEAAWQPW